MSIRLFDGHCDTAFALWRRKASLRQNTCHVDLCKASAFKAYAQVFAFCSHAGLRRYRLLEPEEMLLLPLEKLRQEILQNADSIAFAQTKEDISARNAEHKIAALLSIEGPEMIGCDPDRLEWLRQQGFCMTTLTWNADNSLAGSHQSDIGLTDRGRAFVRASQELGILVDVSHLSEKAFWNLISVTEKPILASHSNCRALRNVTRNLTDDQLRAISETGGTVGLNLYTDFLGERVDFSVLREHLEHMLTICGEDHVALGGDLDGCDSLPDGFSDLSSYSDFYRDLSHAGYSEELLDKIFYQNLQKLF